MSTVNEIFSKYSQIFDRATALVRQQNVSVYIRNIKIKENMAIIEHNYTCWGDGYNCYGHYITVPVNVLLNSQDFDQYYNEQKYLKDLEHWKQVLAEREKEVQTILKNKQWRLDLAQKNVEEAKKEISKLESTKP
jgi:hypothetical protein